MIRRLLLLSKIAFMADEKPPERTSRRPVDKRSEMRISMSEISNFLYEELQETAEAVNEIKNSIRSVKTDIAAFESYICKAKDEINASESLFKSQTYDTCFNQNELDEFIKKKSEYIEKQQMLENKLYRLQEKYDKIKLILDKSLKDSLAEQDYKEQEPEDEGDYSIGIDELYNQEYDRQRIAMDIHDTVVQDLAAVVLKNEFITQILRTDVNRAEVEIKNCSNLLNDCISQLREIIFNLRPMPLEAYNFRESFFKTMELLQKKTDMVISYEYRGNEVDDNYILLVNVLRIIKELCQNCIKHSDGTRIDVVVESSDKNVDITVKDNGTGFEYSDVKNTKGHGLSMVRDRVYIFEGAFNVSRNTKGGMIVEISLPLKYKDKQITEMG